MFAAVIAAVVTAVQARDGPACSAVSGHLNCAQAGSGAVADDLGQSERSKPGSQHLFTSVHSWSADGGVRRRKFGRCFSIRRTAVRRIVDKRTLFPLNRRASSPGEKRRKVGFRPGEWAARAIGLRRQGFARTRLRTGTNRLMQTDSALCNPSPFMLSTWHKPFPWRRPEGICF